MKVIKWTVLSFIFAMVIQLSVGAEEKAKVEKNEEGFQLVFENLRVYHKQTLQKVATILWNGTELEGLSSISSIEKELDEKRDQESKTIKIKGTLDAFLKEKNEMVVKLTNGLIFYFDYEVGNQTWKEVKRDYQPQVSFEGVL